MSCPSMKMPHQDAAAQQTESSWLALKLYGSKRHSGAEINRATPPARYTLDTNVSIPLFYARPVGASGAVLRRPHTSSHVPPDPARRLGCPERYRRSAPQYGAPVVERTCVAADRAMVERLRLLS